MNELIKLPSGRELALLQIPFREASRALRIVSNEIKTVDIKFEGGLKEIMGSDINTMKNLLLQLLGSQVMEDLVFDLMGRCKYNGKVINRETFEEDDARKDYLPVAKEVLLHTLKPFFGGLG